jgi:predicted metal-dependent phosphoesterase TrpH
MLKTDLHLHTNNIIKHFDSHIAPKQLIDRAAKLKFHVLSITEHTGYKTLRGLVQLKNPLGTYERYKDYAKSKGILLIPGVEIYIEGKDILLINFKGDYRKYKNIEDLEKLKKENVMIIAPHPYFPGVASLNKELAKHIKLFDAIELSHFYMKNLNFNKKAEIIAKKYKKPLVANSDAHFLFAFGRNYTYVFAEKKIDSILEAIRKNNVKIMTKPWDIGRFSAMASYHIYSNLRKELQ